jgi:hypothetical protein
MQTIAQVKGLAAATKARPTSPAPDFVSVRNKPAIGGIPDLASENAAQTDDRSVMPADEDHVASLEFAAILVVVVLVLGAIAWFAVKI